MFLLSGEERGGEIKWVVVRKKKNSFASLAALQKNQTGLHVRVGVNEWTAGEDAQKKQHTVNVSAQDGHEVVGWWWRNGKECGCCANGSLVPALSKWAMSEKKQEKKRQHCRNRGGDVPKQRCTHGWSSRLRIRSPGRMAISPLIPHHLLISVICHQPR